MGGLIHLPLEKIQAFGLTQCTLCLQVRAKGMRHPRNCRAIEADAAAELTHAALRACLHSGSMLALQPQPNLTAQSWQDIASHTVVPLNKFPASPTLRASFREVFLLCTKPLLEPNPPEAAWKLFALLPWLLLQRPAAKKGLSVVTILHKRIQNILGGRWSELITEASANEQVWTNLFSQPRRTTQDPERQRLARVQALASQGDISKAANILASNAVILSPLDPDVASKLSSLLQTVPYNDTPSEPSQDQNSPPTLTTPIPAQDVLTAIKRSGSSVAAGPTAWHLSAIKALAPSQGCLDRIALLLSKMLHGDVPKPMLDLLASGSLTVLSKASGGIRPIVTRSSWIRLLSKVIVLKEQRPLARALTPIQCGVGLQGGTEFMSHSIRQLSQQNPEWAVTAIDLSNAYGTVSRAFVRQQLLALREEDRPLTLAYFERFCAPAFTVQSGSFSMSIAEGVIQGDPLSPLFFALALQPGLTAAKNHLLDRHQHARLFAYLDDVCLVAPPQHVVSTVQALEAAITPAHLRTNAGKTQLFSYGGPSDALDAVSNDLGVSIQPAITILGSTIAPPHSVPAEDAAPLPKDEELFTRLNSLQSLQVRLLLLRASVSKQYIHLLRTTAPHLSIPRANSIDKLIKTSLQGIFGLDSEPLDESIMSEACLPSGQGGVGVPSLVETQASAFVSSLLSTIQQWRHYEPDNAPFLQQWLSSSELSAALDAVRPLVATASSIHEASVFPTDPSQVLAYTQTSKLQKKLQGYKTVQTIKALIASRLTSSADRAQFLSKTCRGASAFLGAIPTDRSLYISNHDFHMSLRLWLRLPVLPLFAVPENTPCMCHAHTPLTELHLLNCNGEALRDQRHNVLVYCVQDMLVATQQNPVHLEPRASTHGHELHRFDLAVSGFGSFSNNLKLDVTVRNPLASHIVSRAAAARLVAATEAVNEKSASYARFLAPSDTFMPLAIEAYGGAHHNLFKLISACAQRCGNIPPESTAYTAPTFSSYWLQRIMCTLWRENCRLITTIIRRSLSQIGASTWSDLPVPELDDDLVAPASAGVDALEEVRL